MIKFNANKAYGFISEEAVKQTLQEMVPGKRL